MAHRSNVIPVGAKLDSGDLPKEVQDPVCGSSLKRENVRQMLVRTDTIYYFCSKECLQKFTSPQIRKQVA